LRGKEMKKLLWENKLLVGIITIAIIIAIIIVAGRANVEKNAKTYDIILDFTEISQMAAQSDHDVAWWINEFKGLGINKVGLTEENLLSLSEDKETPVSAKTMYEVMKDANWKENYPLDFINSIEAKGFDEYDLLVEAKSNESYEFINSALINRFDKSKYLSSKEAIGGCILINGSPQDTLYAEKFKSLNSIGIGFTEQDEIIGSKIVYISLGLLPKNVSLLESMDMQIIPRTSGYVGWNSRKYAEAVISDYEKLKQNPEYILFSGEQTLGHDDGSDYISEVLKKNGTIIGMIENTTQLQNIMQDGLSDIVNNSGYNSVRVFTVWNYIQNRYQYYGYKGSEEIQNTLYRAVVERNIRVIYFKPIKVFKDNHAYITDVNEYKTLLTNVKTRLSEQNFELGKASVMDAKSNPFLLKLILGLGCAAAAVFLLKTIIPVKKKFELAILGISILGVIGVFFWNQDLAALVTSFSYAVIFPCAAMIYMLKQSKDYTNTLEKDTPIVKIIIKGSTVLFVSVIIVLIGGIVTAAPISEISYMLEMNIFRGVKVSQLLPIAFFPLAYLAYYGFGILKTTSGKLEMGDLKDMMNSSIKIWMVFIGMLGVGLGAYYILRTGHDSKLIPSTFEMLMRNTLEEDLIARPRTKEFLFAFPAIMLLVYTSIRQFKIWPILFGVSAVIGLTSVVNTFMHIRTPIYLGLARTALSLGFGLLIGIIGILVFEGIYILYLKNKGKSMLNE
jgi:hypothetical protein